METMRSKLCLMFSVCTFLLAGNSVFSQTTHFLYTANTGNNATIGIPTSINPTIGGVAIAVGDEIGVFTPAGLCVGAAVWTGSNIAITVWGDNNQTTAVDGIKAGEQMQFRMWRKSTNTEYPAQVTFTQGTSNYTANGIYQLGSLIVISQLLPVTNTTHGGSFSTIQAAVNSSTDGDTLVIASGIYYESINTHNLNLAFIGSGSMDSTIIDGNKQNGILIKTGAMIRNLTIRNCAVGIVGDTCSPGVVIEVIDCRLTNNVVGMQSSGWAEDRFMNCVFNNNGTGYIHSYYGVDSHIQNSTFVNNTTDISFAPGYYTVVNLNIFNSILRDQISGTTDNKVILNYCNYDPTKTGTNVVIGEGCQTADPLFADTTNKNYTLQATSPAINAGSSNSFYKDIDGTRNDLGFTGGRRIFLNAPSLDYGYIALNRTKDLVLEIDNFSKNPLTINSIDLGNYQISTGTYVPFTLPINSRKLITFTIQPTSAGSFSCTVKLHFSNDSIASDIAEFPASSFCVSYSGGVINVPSQAPTIQSAVDVSLNGETVLLDSNVYNEKVSIVNKNLKLLGNDLVEKVVLDGGGGTAITTNGSNVEMSNLSIRNSSNGILAENHTFITLHKSILFLNTYAIFTNGHTSINVDNSLFHHNSTAIQMSYYVDYDNHIINSTFGNNTDDIVYSPSYGSLPNMYVTNSILGGIISADPSNGSVFLNYCNYDPTKTGTNVVIQNGNQTTNPSFINAPSANYRLNPSSSCINAGSPDTSGLNLPKCDLDNNRRIWQGRIDIGAYEYGSLKPGPVLINPPNNASYIPSNVIFKWNHYTGMDTYRFQIGADSLFINLVVDDSSIVDTSTQTTLLTKNSKYFWRVEAKGKNGVTDWSDLSNFTTSTPLMAVSDSAIHFADRAKGDSANYIINIINKSTWPLTIINISLGNNIFRVDTTTVLLPAIVEDSLKVRIWFKPSAFGVVSDTLKIESDGGTAKVAIIGSSPIPTFKSLKTSIAYGNVTKNTTKKDTLGITNSSINTLIVDSIYTKTNVFTVDRVSGTAGADTLKLVVSFTPGAITTYIDTLYLRNNSAAPLVKIPLSGNCTTGIEDIEAVIPSIYSLAQNFPNPFNPGTTLKYGLPARSSVRLVIYNVLGQVVKELVNTEQQAGYQSVVWNANVASGLYFYQLEATSLDNPNKRFIETKKMLLLR